MRCITAHVLLATLALTNTARADDLASTVSECMQGSIVDITTPADQGQMDLLFSAVVTVMDQAKSNDNGPDSDLLAYFDQQLFQLRSGTVEAIPLATANGPILHWTDFNNTSHCLLPSTKIVDGTVQQGQLMTLANTSDQRGDWTHIVLVRGARK